jgi:hypothetical protein
MDCSNKDMAAIQTRPAPAGKKGLTCRLPAKIAAGRQALPAAARNTRHFHRFSANRSAAPRHTMPGMDDATGSATDKRMTWQIKSTTR